MILRFLICLYNNHMLCVTQNNTSVTYMNHFNVTSDIVQPN